MHVLEHLPDLANGNGASHRRSCGQRGRSVIELSVTLGVLGVLLTVAGPRLPSILEMYALRGTTYEVFAQLQRARMAAVKENHRFNVTVLNDTQYTVHDDTNSNGTVDSGETVTTFDITDNGTGVKLSSAGTTITFAPDATAPTYGTITVQGLGGLSRAIQVSRGGRIKIQ